MKGDLLAQLIGVSLMGLAVFDFWSMANPDATFAFGCGLAMMPNLRAIAHWLQDEGP